MKTVLIILLMSASFGAFAGQIVTNSGYVKMANHGAYKGQYIFAKTLAKVANAINSVGPLPDDAELFEVCDWAPEFKTPDPNFVIKQMNIASMDKALIEVTYYDNGNPLAGMCVDNVIIVGN